MYGFEVIRKVAGGSAVDAFLANSAEGRVVVQVSHPSVAQADHATLQRFVAQSNASMRHPGLLTWADAQCGVDGRFTFTSLPVSGRTAAQHLVERGVLSGPEARRWGLALCDVLEHLHNRHVVHGHLSPANVFLEGDLAKPDPRLLDTSLLLFRGTSSLRTREVLVPAEYLSPERAAGQRASAASDVYGLAVLLFELLTGEAPFRSRELHLSAVTPELPAHLAGWRTFFDACFVRDPSRRLPSMAAVRAVLLSLDTAEVTPVIPGVEVGVPLSPPSLVETGTKLGAWVVQSVLGVGGMGRVFSAVHERSGRRVAVKQLKPELATQPAMVQRFVQEARSLARVRHPNVIEVYELVQEPARTWFVMEYLEGVSLRDAARLGPMSVARAAKLVRQAADGLSAVHLAGVVHRDLKPENLHVCPNDVVKVIDFGVARVRSADITLARSTQVGMVVGTPLWMAPEQVLGHDVDGRSDVYALATVLFVLLARRFPFEGRSSTDVVMKRLQVEAAELPQVTAAGDEIPQALRELVRQSLSRDPNARPLMAEFAAALEGFELLATR